MAQSLGHRLVELGMVPEVALRIHRFAETNVEAIKGITELGVPAPVYDELRRYVPGGITDPRRLVELGVPPPQAALISEYLGFPQGAFSLSALSSDDGAYLVDDDEQLMETYNDGNDT